MCVYMCVCTWVYVYMYMHRCEVVPFITAMIKAFTEHCNGKHCMGPWKHSTEYQVAGQLLKHPSHCIYL